MPNTPTDLHVSDLIENSEVQISWATVPGATGYEVDAYLPSEENGETTWSWVNIYTGSGIPLASPNLGLSWNELDSLDKTWDEIDALDLTWDQFENQLSAGFTWDSADARYLTFDEIDAADLTWDEWDNQMGDDTSHLYYLFDVPNGLTVTRFRIRAFDSNSSMSAYLTTTDIFVIAEQQIISSIKPSSIYSIQIDGIYIRSFLGDKITLTYDSSRLEFYGYEWMSQRKPCPIPYSLPNVYNDGIGHFYITCSAEIPNDVVWSGLILKLFFRPKIIGKTIDLLEYKNTISIE